MKEIDREFREGQDCPFCDGKLVEKYGKLECSDKDCYFNKVVWK